MNKLAANKEEGILSYLYSIRTVRQEPKSFSCVDFSATLNENPRSPILLFTIFQLAFFLRSTFWYWKEFYEWTSRRSPEDTCYGIFLSFFVPMSRRSPMRACFWILFNSVSQMSLRCWRRVCTHLIHSTVNKLLNLVPQFHINNKFFFLFSFLSSFATSISRQSNFFKFLLLSSRDDQAAKIYLFLIWYKALIFLSPAKILEKGFLARVEVENISDHPKSVRARQAFLLLFVRRLTLTEESGEHVVAEEKLSFPAQIERVSPREIFVIQRRARVTKPKDCLDPKISNASKFSSIFAAFRRFLMIFWIKTSPMLKLIT